MTTTGGRLNALHNLHENNYLSFLETLLVYQHFRGMDATLKCTDLLVLLFSNLNFKQVLVLRQRSVFSIDTISVSEPIFRLIVE